MGASDVSLNRSISTLVCAANTHREATTENSIPFCVATVDRDEDTTYQLIGFGDICKNPEYRLQGHLSPKNVGDFAATNWQKIGNAQFRDVELIPCSELGLEEGNGISWTKAGSPAVIGLVISALLFIKKARTAATIISIFGGAASLIALLFEWQAETHMEEAKRQRIHELLSETSAIKKN